MSAACCRPGRPTAYLRSASGRASPGRRRGPSSLPPSRGSAVAPRAARGAPRRSPGHACPRPRAFSSEASAGSGGRCPEGQSRGRPASAACGHKEVSPLSALAGRPRPYPSEQRPPDPARRRGHPPPLQTGAGRCQRALNVVVVHIVPISFSYLLGAMNCGESCGALPPSRGGSEASPVVCDALLTTPFPVLKFALYILLCNCFKCILYKTAYELNCPLDLCLLLGNYLRRVVDKKF